MHTSARESSTTAGRDPEPIEVEVVRLPRADDEPAAPASPWSIGLGSVRAGLLIDLADLASVNVPLGLVLGTLVGWWVGGKLGLPLAWRVALTLGSAVYCAAPRTQLVPLGTILGALWRADIEALRERGARHRAR